MRIDFSEAECRNCYHCRSLGILNTQESEPSNVIVSSDTSMPVSSGPVQALEHDSAAVGSTSTSSPVQAISHDSAPVGSTSKSSPIQALSHDSAAVGSSSKSSPVQTLGHDSVGSTSKSSPVQALGHDSAVVGSISTSCPVQTLGHDAAATGSISTSRLGSQTPSAPPVITSVSYEPARTLDLTSFRSDASGAPTVQAISGSGASATSTSSTSSTFQSSSLNILGFSPAVTSVSSAPTQAFGQTTFGFGSSPNGFKSPFAVTSVSSAPTQPFGQTTVRFNSSTNRFELSPAVTSVSSAPTQAFGSNTCGGFNLFATQPIFGSMQAPVQATSSFGAFPGTTPSIFGSMQAPAQATPSFGAFPGTTPSIFGSMQAPAQATPSFGAFPGTTPSIFGSIQAPAQATSSFGAFSATTPSIFGSMQAPVQATFGSGTSTSSSFLPFGCVPAPPMNGSSLFGPMQNSPWTTNSLSTGGSVDPVRCNPFGPNPSTPTEVFGATPGSVSWPAQDFPRTALGSSPSNRFGQNISTTGSNSVFPGFGVDYFPGSNSSPYGPNPYTTGGGLIFDGPKTSSPQPFGFNGPNQYTTAGGSIFDGFKTSSPPPFGFNAATTLPSSFSSPATFSSNPNTGFRPSPFYNWSCHDEQCIRHPRYAPTPDGEKGGMYISISASKSHPHKSHEELRWEDYKKGNKGSKTNAVFSYPQMSSPSIFASPSVPDHPQRTTFVTPQETSTSPGFSFSQHNAAISSSVQRPHETVAVSSSASGCTACGATTSTSASGYSYFNGATATLAPPSAATTYLPGQFFPTYGYVPTYGYGRMMFGTTPAAQVTTPALQAHPFNGYILLPYGAMGLQ